MVYVDDGTWERLKELAKINRTSASALAELGMELIIEQTLGPYGPAGTDDVEVSRGK